jgi:hypothetical protein
MFAADCEILSEWQDGVKILAERLQNHAPVAQTA